MTSPGAGFQQCTESCNENVTAPNAVSSDLGSTDGLTVLARIEIVTILVHYQPSYNTSHMEHETFSSQGFLEGVFQT